MLLCRGLLGGIRSWGLLMWRLRWLLGVRRLRGLELWRLRLWLLLVRRLGMRGLRWRLLGVGWLLLLGVRTLLVVIWSLALLTIPARALLPIGRNLLCIREAAHGSLRPTLHGHRVPLWSLGPIWLPWVPMSLLRS